MGKKKMSGSREPRKPKQVKLPPSAPATVSTLLSGNRQLGKGAR